MATLKGHTKKVTSVIYHPSQVLFKVLSFQTCLNSLTNRVIFHFLLPPLLVCGLLCISRQYHPCVVCHRGQLCPGGACSRCRCHWTFPSCYWGLPAQLLGGSGVWERKMLDSDINQQSVIYKQSLFFTLMSFILSRHHCVVLGIFWYPDWKGPHQSHWWECWLR